MTLLSPFMCTVCRKCILLQDSLQTPTFIVGEIYSVSYVVSLGTHCLVGSLLSSGRGQGTPNKSFLSPVMAPWRASPPSLLWSKPEGGIGASRADQKIAYKSCQCDSVGIS